MLISDCHLVPIRLPILANKRKFAKYLSILSFFQKIDAQTERQTDRQTDRLTDRQTDREAGIQTEQTDRLAGGQTGRQEGTQAGRKAHRQADRQTDRQINGKIKRERFRKPIYTVKVKKMFPPSMGLNQRIAW